MPVIVPFLLAAGGMAARAAAPAVAKTVAGGVGRVAGNTIGGMAGRAAGTGMKNVGPFMAGRRFAGDGGDSGASMGRNQSFSEGSFVSDPAADQARFAYMHNLSGG
jgi:hypothetical protein